MGNFLHSQKVGRLKLLYFTSSFLPILAIQMSLLAIRVRLLAEASRFLALAYVILAVTSCLLAVVKGHELYKKSKTQKPPNRVVFVLPMNSGSRTDFNSSIYLGSRHCHCSSIRCRRRPTLAMVTFCPAKSGDSFALISTLPH